MGERNVEPDHRHQPAGHLSDLRLAAEQPSMIAVNNLSIRTCDKRLCPSISTQRNAQEVKFDRGDVIRVIEVGSQQLSRNPFDLANRLLIWPNTSHFWQG